MTERGVELFDLLAQIGSRRSGGLSLVFVCYLDDSHSDRDPIMTMAGYVAPLAAWSAFEAKVEPIFADHGVTLLHATDFHRGRGEFRDWSAIRRNTFVDQLYDVLVQHVPMGISRRIHQKTYRQRQEETGLNKSMSATGVAFSSVLLGITQQNSLSETIRREGLSIVVESGKYDAELSNFYKWARPHEIFADSLRGLTFVTKQDSRAIQMADFLAFYSRREADQAARFQGKLWLPKEKIYRRFYKRITHSCLTCIEPYKSRIEDWRPMMSFTYQNEA